ncbi:MAG: cysteine--tRNA ligase [Bacteroidia bacterium]|nr:cysteine--tRNA ligase [Bacteroidia bacterium]MDW8159127.1 cysteine--tRNA ligase [Bacteroidia bacterium]
MEKLHVYNSLTRRKEVFEPISPPFVGMYVCGPTVYGDAHLGHARPAITFDVVYRYLRHLGYKVRYVRNITDVGHLENDADEGEDKIAKKAKLEQLEPMEVAQYYTDRYHEVMQMLNVLRPSIEPRATGHIPEQIRMIEKIIENGFAYVVNGSVYLDVVKYAQYYKYGELSGRENLDELLSGSRELEGQTEKKNPFDFALWKKASPEHIMRWQSPWGEGFPGWHIECSAMSIKYLGECTDIHGGGMDLKFPHHEAEIAQTNACLHPHPPRNEAKYWMHNNLVTINGQKMGKSLGNFITLEQFFSGNHPLLLRSYSPMTIRFFILQSHYRSTLDFSNDALTAAEKGLQRLLNGLRLAKELKTSPITTFDLNAYKASLYAAMNDDFNSAMVIAQLFEGIRLINAIDQGMEKITASDLEAFISLLNTFTFDILGLKQEIEDVTPRLEAVMNILIELRNEARKNKNYALSDAIRDKLAQNKILLKDTPEGTRWQFAPTE